MAVLLLGIFLAACDYESPTGATTGSSSGAGGDAGAAGAAGSGNAGGAGGAGGGMSQPVCSSIQEKVALNSWPPLGFEQALPEPEPDVKNGAPAEVMSIDAAGLGLRFDGAASDVRLGWAGPNLNQVFILNEKVTVKVVDQKIFHVAGNNGQAVVMRYGSATVPSTIPSIPVDGPNLRLDVECVYEQVKGCEMAERRTLYTLTAAWNGTMVTIPSGMTGTIENWQIYHAKSMNFETYAAPECLPEKFFDGVVHALQKK